MNAYMIQRNDNDDLPPVIYPPGAKDMYSDHKELGVLLEKLFQERAIDFRQYNKSTLERRLNKRLNVRKVKNYKDYAEVLDQYPDEYEMLLDAFTVNLTEFFRDTHVFELLKKTMAILIEKHIRDKQDLRI